MTPEFYILMLAALTILAWHMSLHPVLSHANTFIFARTSQHAIQQFSQSFQIPTSHVIAYQHHGRQKMPSQSVYLTGTWSVEARPVVGDHIHMAISFWIHGKARTSVEHDRNPIETMHYEPPFGKDPHVCHVPGNVSYQKVWPHAGVHTHCDGLIHVHPWSAPRTLRKEGLDVTLGLWFDQVGIQYREYPDVSLEFADGSRYDSNATHRWHVAEKQCHHGKIDATYTKQLDNIWLGYAYSSYVLWFDTIGSKAPPDIDAHIQRLQHVGVHGAFGRPYPQTCI